jgi:PST family polysaccharide transporter
MGYKKDIIKGVSWIGLLRFSTKAVGFLETIILAKILIPSQFGAYSVALLSLGVLEVLTETGVNLVLMQEEKVDDFISSAWVVSILRGVLISLILFITAPLIANFFHSPQSLILLHLIALAPLLRGFINPSVVKLQKDLLFGKDFRYRIIILVIDTITSITITYLTKNPVGIVIGLLTGIVIELVWSFFIIKPRPTLRIERTYVNVLFHRGKWATGSAIFDYLFYNADNIVVGRLLGTSALGIYQLGYSLAVIPVTEIGRVFLHVTAPVFVKIAGTPDRLRKAFWQTVTGVFLLSVPVTLFFLFFPHFFLLLLGQKWSGIVTILPVLALLGLVKSVSNVPYALFVGVNKLEYSMISTLVTIVGLFALIVPLILHFGLVGAGMAALVGSLVALPFIIFYLRRVL